MTISLSDSSSPNLFRVLSMSFSTLHWNAVIATQAHTRIHMVASTFHETAFAFFSLGTVL